MDKSRGKLFVVGIGPGNIQEMTIYAGEVLRKCDVITGYKAYINLIEPFHEGKEIIVSGMGDEVQRCRRALKEAAAGRVVAIVSSGDAGIYGMAGLVFEIAKKDGVDDRIEIEVVSGVPAFVAAGALAGAPFMNDFTVISLSDLLTEWETIEKRLEAAAAADFVTCLYNPKSKKRIQQIKKARDIFLRHRKKDTPCFIVCNVCRKGQAVTNTNLNDMLNHEIDMHCVVIIGNSQTLIHGHRMISPRGYLDG